MAKNSTDKIDWTKLDDARLEFAVKEIEKSENLRFFFRLVFSMVGVTGTPDGYDELAMAKAVGRHGVGTDLIELINGYNPTLFSKLLLEDALERQKRTEGDY